MGLGGAGFVVVAYVLLLGLPLGLLVTAWTVQNRAELKDIGLAAGRKLMQKAGGGALELSRDALLVPWNLAMAVLGEGVEDAAIDLKQDIVRQIGRAASATSRATTSLADSLERALQPTEPPAMVMPDQGQALRPPPAAKRRAVDI